MTDFVATKSINIFETIQEAVADLETQLEDTVDTAIIRECTVKAVEGTMWASVLVWTTL